MVRSTQFKMVLLGVVSLTGLSTAAMAQDWIYGPAATRGLYLEFAVGPTFVEDTTFTTRTFRTSGPTPGLAGPFNINSSFSAGYALGGRIGYGFPNGLRLEEEIMYRYNDLDTASISGPRLSGTNLNSINGYNQSVAILTNVIYDWQNSTRFTPYVGIGGGALYVKETTNVQGVTPFGTTVNFEGQGRSTWVGAIQPVGGVNIAITPTISASVDYRYLHGFGVTSQNDYDNHTIFVGLRYTFGPVASSVPGPY